MSLPSQNARASSSGRAYMYRRKRRNPKALAAAGVGGLAVLVVILWATGVFGRAAPELGPRTAGAATPPPEVKPVVDPLSLVLGDQKKSGSQKTEPPPSAGPSEPTTPPGPAPVEIRMGTGGEKPPAKTDVKSTRQEPKPAVDPDPQPAPPPYTVPAPAVTPGGSLSSATLTGDSQSTLSAAREKLAAGDPVTARTLLNRLLTDDRIGEQDRAALREEIAGINGDLIFSPRVMKDDPYVELYTVQPNDSLVKIAKNQGLTTDHRLIQRVNRISNPSRIALGQKLKLIRGPFHAIVNKSAFRMDVYIGPSDSPDSWTYVRSFKVGLGTEGSTPIGSFIVRKDSKLVNPHWVNPRTGEKFDAEDPKNPIGERWIGLEGTGDAAAYVGYGIHGTIEPDSIGQQRSMGCVRLSSEDIEQVYELLGERVSHVEIRP